MSLDDRLTEFAERSGDALKDIYDLSSGVRVATGLSTLDDLPNGVYFYVGTPTNLIPVISLPMGYITVRGEDDATDIYTEAIGSQTYQGLDYAVAVRTRTPNNPSVWGSWQLIQSASGAAVSTVVTGVSSPYSAQLSRNSVMGQASYKFSLSVYTNTVITGPITFTLPNPSGINVSTKAMGFLRVGDIRYPLSMTYNASTRVVTITAETFENGVCLFKPTSATFPLASYPTTATYNLDISVI